MINDQASMTIEEIKKYEEKLLELQGRLSREIKDVIKDTDMGSETDHLEEESDESEERGAAYAIQIPLKERLNAVLDALQKIKSGTYGVCEKCKGAVEARVLEVDPESRFCRECKKQGA